MIRRTTRVVIFEPRDLGTQLERAIEAAHRAERWRRRFIVLAIVACAAIALRITAVRHELRAAQGEFQTK